MKTLLLIILSYLGFSSIYSQSEYFPLIEADKTWHVLEGDWGGFQTYTYKVEGDTIINQENFKFLYRSNEEFPVNWEKYGYIMEDEDKRVFYSSINIYDTNFNEPAMVYDFGVEENDTLIISSFAYNLAFELEIVISDIDSVVIGDDYRRRIIFTCSNGAYEDNFWIEGIGSNNGLIEPGFYCYIACPFVELLCVKEGDDVIYHDDYYTDCFIVGIDEKEISQQAFSVYPNPAKDNIYIRTKTNFGTGFEFVLYDLESEIIIRRKIIDFSQLVINTTELKDGLYLYRIIDSGRLMQNGKIIIKK